MSTNHNYSTNFERMFTMKRISIVAAFCLIIALSFALPSNAASKKRVWKIAHAEFEGTSTYVFAEKLKEEVEKEFNGEVDIQVFPAGQLGSYEAMQEQVQTGGLEFTIPTTAPIQTIVPEYAFTSINFILSPEYMTNYKALNQGETMKFLGTMLEKKNLRVLKWLPQPFSCWSSNTPLQKLEDFKGLKIRVYPSTQIIANYKALKSNPTPIPYAEVYSALQLNVATAQENPIQIIYSNKFYEVQKYVIISNHTTPIDTLTTSCSFWNSLNKEEQEKVLRAADKAALFAINGMNATLKDSLEKIKASGNTTILELAPKERERLAEASKAAYTVYLDMCKDNGAKVLKMWKADLNKFGTK